MEILSFLVVYLVPVIPALIVYYFLGPTKAGAEGRLFGFAIKVGGGAAAYLIFMLAAFFIYPSFIRVPEPERQVRLFMEVSGDPQALAKLRAVADSFNVILVQNDKNKEELRFPKFALQNNGQTLSSNPVRVRLSQLGKTYHVGVRPELDNVKYVLGSNFTDAGQSENQIVLKEDNTVALRLQTISDDPLVVDLPMFHTQDWTSALALTTMAFNPLSKEASESLRGTKMDNPFIKASEDLEAVEIFMNETNSPIGEIALTDYSTSDPDAKPSLIEATIRRITGDEHRALSLRMAKNNNLYSRDSDEVFRTIGEVASAYRTAGTELGYIRVVKGDHEEGARSGALSLRAGGKAFRVGPLSQGIPPTEGIALIVKLHYDYYWEPIKPGLQDWLGGRAAYPTRLVLWSIKLGLSDANFDKNSVRSEFILPDGSRTDKIPDSHFKWAPKYITSQAALLNRGAKQTIFWAWQ